MLNDRDHQILINLLPFREHITPEMSESLRRHSQVRDWYAGEKISDLSRTGIGMIVVLSGRVRISLVSASAHQVTISVERREDIVYIGGNPAPQVLNNFELEAEIDTRAIVVPLSDFEALLHSDLRIENTVLRAVLGLFNAILFDMQNFLFLDLSQRLAAHLLFEYSQQGSLSLATTHQRIANSIASSREVVSRMLKQWEHADIVRLSRGRVIIRDAAVLRRLSEE
ncbi:MAG: Crp/Fnr family transcriptional regulator [Lachnospiraceae bacterium]|nr:Crp/Fnr family transcriptional regulator [Lachnospiraceae bacterium]